MISKKVFVFEYRHRHGTDISCYRTKKVAEQAAAGEALQWLSEVKKLDKKEEIVRLIQDEKYWEAVAVYCEAAQEEMEIFEALVYDDDPTPFKEYLAQAKKWIKEQKDDGDPGLDEP